MTSPECFAPLPNQDEAVDWTYEMRREMQEIIPGLYLGPYSAAMKTKRDYLLEHKITHIVCIRQQIEAHFIRPNFPELFNYLVLDIADTMNESIIHCFPKVRQFLDNCFMGDGKALIHGNAGISRSAALVIAYVMEKHGLTYRSAYSLVQQKRFCISPNERFIHQLMEYEPIYRAKFSMPIMEYAGFSASQCKRSFDDVDDAHSMNCCEHTSS